MIKLRMSRAGVRLMKRRIFAFTFTLAVALVQFSLARAATFSTVTERDGKIIVALNGEIAEGDSKAFRHIVQAANAGGHVVELVTLSSPGGNLLESVKLAAIIQFGKMATSVLGSSMCASACFIIFAAGNEKYANYTASVGVHGASNTAGKETARSDAATVTMARVVKRLGVPPSIIGKMVVTPPDQMVWLTPDDLRSMGVIMVGKPAQVPPDPFTSQLPPQVRPQDKSLAAQSSAPPSWDKLLDRAMQLSMRENNGSPQIARICQPKLKVCVNGLSFKAPDGTYMVMKVTDDMNDKMLRREVCSFNESHDVRLCVNWDTGQAHRDMKNKHGDWYQIANY
jgi:hypothetical protein